MKMTENDTCSETSDVSVGCEIIFKNDKSDVKKDIIREDCINDIQPSYSSCSEHGTDEDTDHPDDINGSNQSYIEKNIEIENKLKNSLLFCDNPSIFNINSSPIKFKNSFVRNAQLLAENFMKQSLSKSTSFKDNENSSNQFIHNDSQQWKQLVDKKSDSISKNNHLSFNNLHSHLNAITQIAHTFPLISKTSSSLNAEFPSKENSVSPISQHSFLTSQCLQIQPHNISEQNLKFSIDNILKADFGRRISNPLLTNHTEKQRKNVGSEHNIDPIDLTKTEDSKISTKEAKTEKQPLVWPAWIYCTRYSDRPSSGN